MTGKTTTIAACRAQAAICRGKAGADIARRDYWLGEARKWEQRAEDETDHGAISYRSRESRPVAKP